MVVPLIVIVSPEVSPRVTFPFATKAPVIVAIPETVKLSWISTVPAAESRIRFPEVVSISFVAVIPRRIASI